MSVQDRLWCMPKLTTLAQQQCADTEITISPIFVDPDDVLVTLTVLCNVYCILR